MSKIKLLFVSPLPPPYYGSAISSKMTLEILHEHKDYDVSSLKLNYSESIYDLNKFGTKKVLGTIKLFLRVLFSMFKSYDIIYLMPATSGKALLRDSIIFCLLRLKPRSKIIIHFRANFREREKKHQVYKRLLNVYKYSNFIILLGDELLNNIPRSFIRVPKYILPNGIPNRLSDQQFSKIYLDKASKDNEELSLLFLSNMNEEKGWKKVLEVCNLLNKNGVKFHCDFAGAWEKDADEKYFNDFVIKNNLEFVVKHHGQINMEDKDLLFRTTDILLFPTEYSLETFGRVIIEAMEFGIPVITTNIGAIPSVVQHGKTGFVLQENSVENLYEMINVLKNREMRFDFSKESRNLFIKYFTEDVYRKRFLTILREIQRNGRD
jgi:glycosyltransferase involved in cell wall biosynthesis